MNRRCLVIQVFPSQTLPEKRETAVSEMADPLMQRWNQRQQNFTRNGGNL